MNNRFCRFGLSILAFASITICVRLPIANAQNAGSDLPPMRWFSLDDPVTVGSGVEISTTGFGARGVPLKVLPDAPPASQASLVVRTQPQTRFISHDLSSATNIINSLRVNVFAEISGIGYGASLSAGYGSLFASNVNERKWEVDAVRTQTSYFKGDPLLTQDAKNLYNGYTDANGVVIAPNPAGFRSTYGNYFVSSITYRRRLMVRFTSQISSQVNEQDIRAAIDYSSSCFSLNADMSTLSLALSKIGNTSIEIEIEGVGGAQVISAATQQNLELLRDAVANILSKFDDVPVGDDLDGVPGIVDVVKLRSYSTLREIQVAYDPFRTPNEDTMGVALASYIRLEQTRRRLVELKSRNYNVQLTGYLLGKAQEVEVKRKTLTQFMRRLATDQTGQAFPIPKTDVSFVDPEVTRWTLYFITNIQYSDGVDRKQFTFKVSGEIPFTIKCDGAPIAAQGSVDTLFPPPRGGTYNDSVTGIKTQIYIVLFKNNEDFKSLPTLKFSLQTLENLPNFLATDFNSARQVQIVVSPAGYPHP